MIANALTILLLLKSKPEDANLIATIYASTVILGLIAFAIVVLHETKRKK